MKDENKLVITIGRQFGSGGCEVGTKLAQELGLDFYDKNILRMNLTKAALKRVSITLQMKKLEISCCTRSLKSLTPEKVDSFFWF